MLGGMDSFSFCWDNPRRAWRKKLKIERVEKIFL
jgi:hypothetical protein